MQGIAFDKIVCATDLTRTSEAATRYACSLARTFGGRVELVHAWTYLDELDEYALLRPEAIEELRTRRATRLAKEVETWKARGVAITGVALEGRADRVLVEHTVNADVLVLGTAARRGLAHAFVGSVAERILRTSVAPVLVVPASWSIAEDARFAPQSIVVPVDLKPMSVHTLRVGCSLARRAQAKLTVVHAWDQILPAPEGRAEAEAAQTMQKRFAHWLESNAPSDTVKVRPVLRRGDPFEVIQNAVEDAGGDLVITATAGRTGLAHMMLGSVTERVLRQIERPVLTFRRSEE